MELQRFLGVTVPAIYAASDFTPSLDITIPLASEFLALTPQASTVQVRPEAIKGQLDKEYSALQVLHAKITHQISRLQVEDMIFQTELVQLEAQYVKKHNISSAAAAFMQPDPQSTEDMEQTVVGSGSNEIHETGTPETQDPDTTGNVNSAGIVKEDSYPHEEPDEMKIELESGSGNVKVEEIQSGDKVLDEDLAALDQIEKEQTQLLYKYEGDDDSSIEDIAIDDDADQEMSQILMRELGSDFKNIT